MDDAFVLEQFRDEFDPETLQILARAFDLSWRYLHRVLTNPTESDRERWPKSSCTSDAAVNSKR